MDGGLQAGDQDGKWEGRTVQCFWAPVDPLHSGVANLHGPSIWRLTPDISSARSLNLAAMDTKLVAVN